MKLHEESDMRKYGKMQQPDGDQSGTHAKPSMSARVREASLRACAMTPGCREMKASLVSLVSGQMRRICRRERLTISLA